MIRAELLGVVFTTLAITVMFSEKPGRLHWVVTQGGYDIFTFPCAVCGRLG
jgi:hypothetical protein